MGNQATRQPLEGLKDINLTEADQQELEELMY